MDYSHLLIVHQRPFRLHPIRDFPSPSHNGDGFAIFITRRGNGIDPGQRSVMKNKLDQGRIPWALRQELAPGRQRTPSRRQDSRSCRLKRPPRGLRFGGGEKLCQWPSAMRLWSAFRRRGLRVQEGLERQPQLLPVDGQRGVDQDPGACQITAGQRANRAIQQALGLRLRLPDERKIAATTRTDGTSRQARPTRLAAIQHLRHQGSTGDQRACPWPFSGRRRLLPCSP
jgi:hypothetical protein